MSSLARRIPEGGTDRPWYLMLVAVALMIGGAPVALGDTAKSDVVAAPVDASYALYAGPDWQHFFRLDPEDLTYRQDLKSFHLDQSWTDWALSADGSTMVTILDTRTIVVHDGLHGAERFRFESPVPIYAHAVSQDGSRLLVSAPLECGESYCARFDWYLFDTRDGHKLTHIEQPKGQLFEPLVDRDLLRVYTAVIDGDKERAGTWPVTVIAYDLNTGAELGRLALPDVTYGARFPMAANNVPVFERWIPAFALSPDGRDLVVVGFDGAAITSIDTTSLTVEATYPIHQKENAVKRTARWLGFVPTSAEAKVNAGRTVNLVFAPDGRRLYLTGFEGTVDDATGEAAANGLGLTTIDPETGEIVARALDGTYLLDVIPAPDNRNLYVFGPTVIPWTVEGEVPYRLLRLDAGNLATEAEHQFNGAYSILLLSPASPLP